MPVDPLQRPERRLDRRPLATAGEVRAKAGAQVAGATDVEREPARVRGRRRPPDASARPRRASASSADAAPAAPTARRGRRASGRRAPGRGRSASTRISAVARASGSARWHGSVGTPKKCASAARPTRRVRSPSSRRASQTVSTTGAAMRFPVSRSTSRSRKPRSKRALWATRTASPANARSRRTARSALGAPRSASWWMPVSDVTAGGSGARGSTSVSNASSELEATDALRADLADPRRARREPGRLEVDDDEVRVLEEDVRPGRRSQADRPSPPREPRVTRDDVVEERPRERGRSAGEREEDARRLVRGHRPAPGLDELDEAVGSVERELHAAGW